MSSDRNLDAEVESRNEKVGSAGKYHLALVSRFACLGRSKFCRNISLRNQCHAALGFQRHVRSDCFQHRNFRIHPNADPGSESEFRHVVHYYIMPSVAVVQMLDTPLLGVIAHLGIEDAEDSVLVLKFVVGLDFRSESVPVLILRPEDDLVPVQRRAFRDIFHNETACSLCSLAGEPYVALIHTLRRCIGRNGDAVYFRGNKEVFADLRDLPLVVKIMLIDIDPVQPIIYRKASLHRSCRNRTPGIKSCRFLS